MIRCSFELNNKPMSNFKMGGSSFSAYSGLGEHINKSTSECLKGIGPIPRGTYYIFDRQSGGVLGPLRDLITGRDEWFALYAIDGKIDDETYCQQVKRGLFRLHPKGPQGISQGCIVIDKRTDFQRVRSLLKATNKQFIPSVGLNAYGMVTVR